MIVTAVVAAIGAVALLVLLLVANSAPKDKRPELRIEGIKYGIGVIASGGALAALLLAVRRQRLAEQAHALAVQAQALTVRAQAHIERDAAERQVTELYTKAVEQLGSSDAAVRLGGLYALERVAQNNPSQRQTVVNVMCAYLRMPFTQPANGPTARTERRRPTHADLRRPRRPVLPADSAGRDPRQELQVRLTAQRILQTHLSLPESVNREFAEDIEPSSTLAFWPNLELDLTDAVLTDWSLSRAYVKTAVFTGTEFAGRTTSFEGSTFARGALFRGATFRGQAGFDETMFGRATLSYSAPYNLSVVTISSDFSGAVFHGECSFYKAWFDSADFDGARFCSAAFFDYTCFDHHLSLIDVVFQEGASFDGMRVSVGELEADGTRLYGTGSEPRDFDSEYQLVPEPSDDTMYRVTDRSS